NERPEIADVREIVDRGAAGVHADGVIRHRRKRLHGLCQRVVETQSHSFVGNAGLRTFIVAPEDDYCVDRACIRMKSRQAANRRSAAAVSCSHTLRWWRSPDMLRNPGIH